MTKNDDDAPSPWLKGVRGVKGIVPPGRRLSPKAERRPTKWSASGVKGVTPHGGHGPSEGPSVDWLLRSDTKKKAKAKKANQRALDSAKRGNDEAVELLRPGAGFRPSIFADSNDPKSLEVFLKEINDLMSQDPPDSDAASDFAQMISQSHAPFEIVVAFAVLSAASARDESLRHEFGFELERGAKTYFNLARRLDPSVKVPRGLIPESVDPIFYDLPDTAYRVPFAHAAHAFLRMAPLLLRGDPEHDEKLEAFATQLYERFIASRSLGDSPLASMFPWAWEG